MPVLVHNTLSGKKEVFEPLKKELRMYVCGVTPYDACHLGHARCYVVFDVIRRILKSQGFQIRFVQNFTDVDDKIIARSKELGISTTELVKKNIDDFFDKMDALGVERADAYPRVTDNIPEIIALVSKLLDKKAAYILGGDVYFSVRSFPGYGKLSKRDLSELQSGARVDVNKEKQDPLDFVLWKAAKPDEPADVQWDSPWGKGRPGWHIECSAMSLKHLGESFDIHGGGLDLIFPHHENEIAQSEAATGAQLARVWIHNGFVTLNREKMSKSTGNFFMLADIFEKFKPIAVRYMLLSVHYRSPLNFSFELLEQHRQACSNLMDSIARATRAMRMDAAAMDQSETPSPETVVRAEQLMKNFQEAITDDFNTVEGLAAIHQMNSLLEHQFGSERKHLASIRFVLGKFRAMTELLGLDLFSAMGQIFVPAEVTEKCQQRQDARERKDWAASDRLRLEILALGYVVEDTSSGPRILPKASA